MSVSPGDLREVGYNPTSCLAELLMNDRRSLWKCISEDVFGWGYSKIWARDMFERGIWHAAVAFLLALFSPSLEIVELCSYRDLPGYVKEYISPVAKYASGVYYH
jgi:hypothetical protein